MEYDRDIVLTVYMEGTANPVHPYVTQVGLFAEASRLSCTLLPSEQNEIDLELVRSGERQYTIRFHGCGYSYGLAGTLFAKGLKEQCEVVDRYIKAFFDENPNVSIKINFVGQSRGGIGGLYLAKTLKKYSIEKVVLNLCLIDPVPGNFVWISRWLDFFRISNTNQVINMTSIENFGKVVVLYPHIPLPDLAVHAPILIKFPQGCDLDEEVILGCHQGAIFLNPSTQTYLSYRRIDDFLQECGSNVDTTFLDMNSGLETSDEYLLKCLNRKLQVNRPTSRISHSSPPGAVIVRYPKAQYLNRFHESLHEKCNAKFEQTNPPEIPTYMLEIIRPS